MGQLWSVWDGKQWRDWYPLLDDRDDPPDGWDDEEAREAEAWAMRQMPSRRPDSTRPRHHPWVIALRCGAGRHAHPPRVGEVHTGGSIVWWAPVRERPWWASARNPAPVQRIARGENWVGEGMMVTRTPPPPSLRFPCPDRRCSADWNVATDRLETAYWQAVVDGKRDLVFGVDL